MKAEARPHEKRPADALLDADMKVASSNTRVFLACFPPRTGTPAGGSETSYDIQNGLVIMRTVRDGDVVRRYRRWSKTDLLLLRGP